MKNKKTNLLEGMGLSITRAFYDFRSLTERLLIRSDLGKIISPGMGPILYSLYDEDGCTIKEISKRTQLNPCTLTGQLGRMKKAGLLIQKKDKEDKRASRIWLTTKGKSIKKKLDNFHEEVVVAMQGDMSKTEFEKTRKGLLLIIDSMQNYKSK